MSVHENIARLTATLTFDVNTGGLSKFQQMLKRTQQMMMQVSKEAEALQQKLNLKLGVKSSADKAKLDSAVRHNLDRELRLERAAQQARSETFKAELLQQKLVSAGTKENAALQTQLLKDKIQQAVLDAKSAKASQERLKAQGVALRNEQSIEAAKARQSRLESVLQAQRAKTVASQQKALQSLSATQRMELGLQEARTRSQRALARFTEQQAAMKVKSERATEKHQQQQQRFQWATARQQVWEANRDKPKEQNDLSLLGVGTALTGFVAAAYVATRAFDKLAERVEQRQAGASEAEQFNNALETAGGRNVANQQFARQRYLDVSNKYGTEISLDGAKDYAKFVQGQLSLGKSLTQATQIFEDQSATFRAAALNAEAQKRAAYQLNQIRAKGKPEGGDVNDLFDAIGGPVANSIRQAAADRLKFKGKIEDQAGWFKGAVTKGKIIAKDFDQGMANYLKANQDVLAKQMRSIDAEQTRANNQAYVNDNNVNTSPELKDAVLENVKAHRELNEAMQPLRDTMLMFDIGLTQLSTNMLRFASGKNLDGSDKTAAQIAQDRMTTADLPVDVSMVGNHDYSSVDGNSQHQGGPIGEFWNWALNLKDNREGEAKNWKAGESAPLGFLNKMDFSKAWNVPEIGDEQFHRVVRDVFDVQRLHDSYRSKGLGQFDPRDMTVSEWNLNKPIDMKETEPTVTNNITNNPVTTININATTNASAEDIARTAEEAVKTEMQRAFAMANTSLVENK